MTSLFRKLTWWLQRRRKEDELREELRFHLEEEAHEREAEGLSKIQAGWAARRDLGNVTLLREDARTLWSWIVLEQLAQDLRYGLRAMSKNRLFTALAALSLALGIGANTAIYSFMDSILLRSLPVADPASLVVVKWQSKPINRAGGTELVLHSIDGSTYSDRSGVTAAIFPFPAFERLQEAAAPVLSSLFAHKPAGRVNVMIKGEAELAQGEVRLRRLLPRARGVAGGGPPDLCRRRSRRRRSGRGPEPRLQRAALRQCGRRDRTADPHQQRAVQRDWCRAGRVLRRDPAAAPQVYLPMNASFLFDPGAGKRFADPNYYWVEMMGRLRPALTSRRLRRRSPGPSPNGWPRRRPTMPSAPTFRCCASRKARAGSTASDASTRSRSTCCWRWSG